MNSNQILQDTNIILLQEYEASANYYLQLAASCQARGLTKNAAEWIKIALDYYKQIFELAPDNEDMQNKLVNILLGITDPELLMEIDKDYFANVLDMLDEEQHQRIRLSCKNENSVLKEYLLSKTEKPYPGSLTGSRNFRGLFILEKWKEKDEKLTKEKISTEFTRYAEYIEKYANNEECHKVFTEFLIKINNSDQLKFIDKDKFSAAIYLLDQDRRMSILKLCVTEGETLNQYLLSEEEKLDTSFWSKKYTYRIITSDMAEHKGFGIFQKMSIDYVLLKKNSKVIVKPEIKILLDVYSQIITDNPDDPDNYFQRALFCEKMGFKEQNEFLIKQALSDYMEFIKRTPGNFGGHNALANFLMNINDTKLMSKIHRDDLANAINLLQEESKLSIIKLCVTEGHPWNKFLLKDELWRFGIGLFKRYEMISYNDEQHLGRKLLDNMFNVIHGSTIQIETMENYYNSNFML